MAAYRRRDQILAELNAAAGQSFSVIYRALTESSAERKSSLIDKDDVVARIRAALAKNVEG